MSDTSDKAYVGGNSGIIKGSSSRKDETNPTARSGGNSGIIKGSSSRKDETNSTARSGGNSGIIKDRSSRKDETNPTARVLIQLERGVSAYKNDSRTLEHTFTGEEYVSVTLKLNSDYLTVSKKTIITLQNQNYFSIILALIEPPRNGKKSTIVDFLIKTKDEIYGVSIPKDTKLKIFRA